MGNLNVSAATKIALPAELVRRQFADVRHHAEHGVHKGVVFEVLEEDEERCRYRQTTRVGPLRLRQELEMKRSTAGPLVNTVTKGQFAGGTISFTVTETGPDACEVLAELNAPTTILQAPIVPLLRANVRRALTRALAEDKRDLESGSYR